MTLVVGKAVCQCSFGATPSPLNILPLSLVTGNSSPAGNIQDAIPFAEIAPFGVCSSLANPAVAAATAAALGVLTPMPCTPVTSEWAPGNPTVLIGKFPALDQESTCPCAFGGVITISFPGQITVNMS